MTTVQNGSNLWGCSEFMKYLMQTIMDLFPYFPRQVTMHCLLLKLA